jgi:hypothetical protein
MRDDQFIRLQALSEKLLDVFLAEADPESWPGKGIALGAMDAKTRGDLYWVRKTAASVLVLEGKITNRIAAGQLGGNITPGSGGEGEPDVEQQIDADMAAAEKEASRLMRELQGGGKGKKAFNRKVHGST